MGSLDDDPKEGVAEAWAEEIDRRTAQLDAGDVEALRWEDVRARLNKRSRGTSVH